VVIRAALGGGAAIAEDLQFLEGVGSSIAPCGLRLYPQSDPETPTAGKVTLHVAQTVGVDGDVVEPEDVGLIQSLYEESKDPDPPTAWIMRPGLYAVLANRRADAVAAGDKKGVFLFPMIRDQVASTQKGLSGVKAVTTVQLSRNDVKGSASNLHVLLYGNFNRVLIGRSGAMELAASEHIKFLQDRTVLRAIVRSDMGLEHEQSFVITRNLRQV